MSASPSRCARASRLTFLLAHECTTLLCHPGACAGISKLSRQAYIEDPAARRNNLFPLDCCTEVAVLSPGSWQGSTDSAVVPAKEEAAL